MLSDQAADPHFNIADGVIIDANPATARALSRSGVADVLRLASGSLSPPVRPDGRVSADEG